MRFFRRRDREGAAGAAERAPAARARTPAPERINYRSYDSVAEDFDRFIAEDTAAYARDLVAIMDLGPGMRVLDVGTGSGVAAEAARAAAGPDAVVVGADPSVGMLGVARRRGRPAHFVAAAALDLPFRDQTFDAEIATFVLSHLRSLETALFDMRRVLRVGGELGVTAWTGPDDAFTAAWTEVAERHVGREILRDGRARLSPHEERLSRPESLRDTLYAAGFRKIRVEPRQQRRTWTRDDFLAARMGLRASRFIQSMLGTERFERFTEDLRTTFEERFPETFGDTTEALVAVARRED